MSSTNKEIILQVKNLQTSFFTDEGEVKAVNGVDFSIEKGKTLGIVGESGSGKSITSLLYSVFYRSLPEKLSVEKSSLKATIY